MITRYRAELASIGRFGIVGILACVVYVIVAFAGDWLGFSSQKANLFGVVASTTVSFLGHLYYSFRKNGITMTYIWRFAVLSLLIYALSAAGTHAGVMILKLPKPLVVLFVAMAMPLFTWTAGRFWVFR